MLFERIIWFWAKHLFKLLPLSVREQKRSAWGRVAWLCVGRLALEINGSNNFSTLSKYPVFFESQKFASYSYFNSCKFLLPSLHRIQLYRIAYEYLMSAFKTFLVWFSLKNFCRRSSCRRTLVLNSEAGNYWWVCHFAILAVQAWI